MLYTTCLYNFEWSIGMQVVTPIANHQQAINLEALLREDEKLYCICQEPFDESRLNSTWSITKIDV